MVNSPILFLVYNRPILTARVFEEIRRAKPRQLFVAFDGPKAFNSQDKDKCARVRQVVEAGIDWDCEFKFLIHESNLGCFEAVKSALDWFFNQVEQGIILEDDTLPSKTFFQYCDELLHRFVNDSSIWSISGFNFGLPMKEKQGSIFRYRFMNMWGWATWRRTYNKVNYNLEGWKKAKDKRFYTSLVVQNNFFDTDLSWFQYWTNMFYLVAMNKLNTWDFQWIYCQQLDKGYTIYPATNLISNLGFDKDATHTKNPDNILATLTAGEHSVFHPADSKFVCIDKDDDKYIKKTWTNYEQYERSLAEIIAFKFRQIKYYLMYY